jgi:hypothetical protein
LEHVLQFIRFRRGWDSQEQFFNLGVHGIVLFLFCGYPYPWVGIINCCRETHRLSSTIEAAQPRSAHRIGSDQQYRSSFSEILCRLQSSLRIPRIATRESKNDNKASHPTQPRRQFLRRYSVRAAPLFDLGSPLSWLCGWTFCVVR